MNTASKQMWWLARSCYSNLSIRVNRNTQFSKPPITHSCFSFLIAPLWGDFFLSFFLSFFLLFNCFCFLFVLFYILFYCLFSIFIALYHWLNKCWCILQSPHKVTGAMLKTICFVQKNLPKFHLFNLCWNSVTSLYIPVPSPFFPETGVVKQRAEQNWFASFTRLIRRYRWSLVHHTSFRLVVVCFMWSSSKVVFVLVFSFGLSTQKVKRNADFNVTTWNMCLVHHTLLEFKTGGHVFHVIIIESCFCFCFFCLVWAHKRLKGILILMWQHETCVWYTILC